MLSVPPLVDNTDKNLEEVYKKIIPQIEEARIATGYFYLSGFDLYKEDLGNLAEPDELSHAPLRILMGRQTNQQTADEIEEGQNLREAFKQELKDDIKSLNNAQLGRLNRLREFVAEGIVEVRVRSPENGYFHAKGAAFRAPLDDGEEPASDGEVDKRACATIVGSSNFSASGHRNNIELNLTSQDRYQTQAFEDWYDNQWANAEVFSEEILHIIENSDQYKEWKEKQEKEKESDSTTEEELGTYLEPFELYKLLAYDELNGNVSARDSPLYYFQKLGYESAREKLSQYDGCIISDSVGLGKSFIGGELLYDYRQHGDRCLLIVPANLTDQWEDLLQDGTDEDGNPYFGLEMDGKHLDVMSISKFQNLGYEEVQKLRDQFDVLLIDEAHRFRNFGKWRPNPTHDDDYKGTRRHANLRQLRGKTMIMLTATPLNNSATDLKNLISLFTSPEELRNKASLDFDAFDEYIELAEVRKRIAAGKEEVSEQKQQQITEQLQRHSNEISNILNEVMVLRTRKHVKEQIQADEDFEMSFKPPKLHKEQYSLPPAYQPIYRMLPDVMDALHLPHITVKNPQAGGTLKALYKLNLLKRLESSTYAFVQSIETLHQSERRLLGFLEDLPEDEDIDLLRSVQNGEAAVTIDDFVEGEDAAEDLEQTLEEFGFDSTSVRADGGEGKVENELADATIGEVKNYIREDLTLLAYFLTQFIGDVARDAGDVSDHAVTVRQWLHNHNAGTLPEVSEEEMNPVLYPRSDLAEIDAATRDFYEAIFSLREFRDPKIDRLAEVLQNHDQKVLIFTQYRGTADYVYRTLRDNPNSPLTAANSAVVKGGDENKQDIIQRFAPQASGYQSTLAESDETELQYVVATDTLSEGVNLQDVHVVVNYDLPWNPMRIVQRVGRIDRIGSTAEKHVHNFYPDGDIEAAIKLLKRLQAKINDIALIVGKENNILDPNEDQILEKAGVDTQKTIGELEVDEIEDSLRRSREVEDVNELDDTSKNPLLRNAGSNEEAAYDRFLLKQELNEEYGLTADDFEYAEEFFNDSPDERELLFTNTINHDKGPRPGVFGLAHLWFNSEEENAPLGRVRRAFYYKPFGDDVKERSIQTLSISPSVKGEPVLGNIDNVLANRKEIEEVLNDRLEAIREGQVEGAFKQGDSFSKEQETILDFLAHYLQPNFGDDPCSHEDHDTIDEWTDDLHSRLGEFKLANTDEDRILRDTFRHHDEYDLFPDWPPAEFLKTLESFLEENIEASTEYQDTLVRESDVQAQLVCWGIVGT
ncbi:helicase-related protein [Natranaeroarchaeum aerophilus]|uniref:Phospholipase D-like domain-containing protein n=1 Tax=Natranaeroarchaeum aerophilus TaxID=2917711 RepID=A0AAE3K5Y7_9EURY|nr:helicase-related protein [Natranaeroarchaeum aerophilus]MCL9814406.1 phospholipase D-like domain-containing protein [Natranaeroarchaeum aerophilus]